MIDLKERTERAAKRPYFIWDYDLTEEDVRAILRGDNEYEKLWITVRILERCSWQDIWDYLTMEQVISDWQLIYRRMRPQLREPWSI